MELAEKISFYEGQLEERIKSLKQKLEDPALYSEDSPDGNQMNISSAPLEFYDDTWQRVFDKIKRKRRLDALKALMNTFEQQLDNKVNIVDLKDKADRVFADSLLRDLNTNVQQQLESMISSDYQMLQEQLEQTKNNLEAMHKNFEQSVESFKKELNQYMKDLENDESVSRPLTPEKHGLKRQLHTASPTKLNFRKSSAPTRSHIIRTPYKQKVKPFAPIQLNTLAVQGKLLTVPNFNTHE